MDNATHKTGSSFQGAHDDFWYYDRLPPSARRALANALFDWSAGAIYSKWKRAASGFKTGAACAERVKEWDRNQLSRERKRKRV